MADDGVLLEVTPESAAAVDAHLENIRQRVLSGIRVGMQEAMEDLAWKVADKLQGDPIVSRTGSLLEALLQSPHTWANDRAIGGTVNGYVDQPGKGNVDLWLELGTDVPALVGAKGKLYQFFPPDGTSVWTHGHRAFKEKPHPFMEPSLKEDQPNIMEIIQRRLSEAIDG